MMPTIESPPAPALPVVTEAPFPVDLPYEDNENMDSPWHRAQIELFINVLKTNWKGRRFYCGGNMFVHFSTKHVRNRDFRGPDFFVVLDVDPVRRRLYWAVWEEDGRYPDFIIELLSPTTEDEDRTTKKTVYERTFKTHEYFLFDPYVGQLEGWRLSKHYQAISPEMGRIWSEELELWLGTWKGSWDGDEAVWLRFFDRNGRMLPTAAEAEAALASAETARANAATARANAESARANAAESEVERLQKELELIRKLPNQPKS